MGEAANDLLEQLAESQHDIWAHFMDYLISTYWDAERQSIVVPHERARGWEEQAKTLYPHLSEEDKEKDREIVRKFMPYLLE